MAAALSFTACSGEDDLAQEPTQQPAQTAKKIHISVGAGIDNATTRSTVDYTGGVRTLQFTTGDRLYVWGSYGNMDYEPSGQEYYPKIVAGYLDLDADSFDPNYPTNATFSGDLTVYEWTYEVGDYEDEWNEEIEDWEKTGPYFVTTPGYYSPVLSSPDFLTDDPLADFEDVTATLIHKDAVENDDYGILDRDLQIYYWHNCATTVEELMTKQLTVSGVYDPSTKSFALTKNVNQPILNCTIAGLEDGAAYKVDYIYGETAAMSDLSMMLCSSLTATGGTLSFAFFAKPANYYHGIRLTNTADANDTYTVSIGQKSFASKVYNLSRIWDGYSMQKRIVDLSKLSGNYTAQDGDILTGDFKSNVTITDGATVTLSDVFIENNAIYCAGSATINLLGNNSVSNSDAIYINAGTLTIQGSGSLTAQGGDNRPGIGGGSSSANVVIKGGTITASGGEGAAGIGSYSNASFGTITIEGGTIHAWGGDYGAGIGSGHGGSCGNITITGGMVTVWGGRDAAGIGSGTDGGSCGDITIGGSAVIGAGMGGDNADCIGAGMGGDCGLITVDPNMIDVGEGNGFRTIGPMH